MARNVRKAGPQWFRLIAPVHQSSAMRDHIVLHLAFSYELWREECVDGLVPLSLFTLEECSLRWS